MCADFFLPQIRSDINRKTHAIMGRPNSFIAFFLFPLWILVLKGYMNAQFKAIPTRSGYLIFLADNDEISVMLCLSYSAHDGFFFLNLITGCTVVVSDGTFNQKGNQKVIQSCFFLQRSLAKLCGE